MVIEKIILIHCACNRGLLGPLMTLSRKALADHALDVWVLRHQRIDRVFLDGLPPSVTLVKVKSAIRGHVLRALVFKAVYSIVLN